MTIAFNLLEFKKVLVVWKWRRFKIKKYFVLEKENCVAFIICQNHFAKNE